MTAKKYRNTRLTHNILKSFGQSIPPLSDASHQAIQAAIAIFAILPYTLPQGVSGPKGTNEEK